MTLTSPRCLTETIMFYWGSPVSVNILINPVFFFLDRGSHQFVQFEIHLLLSSLSCRLTPQNNINKSFSAISHQISFIHLIILPVRTIENYLENNITVINEDHKNNYCTTTATIYVATNDQTTSNSSTILYSKSALLKSKKKKNPIVSNLNKDKILKFMMMPDR